MIPLLLFRLGNDSTPPPATSLLNGRRKIVTTFQPRRVVITTQPDRTVYLCP